MRDKVVNSIRVCVPTELWPVIWWLAPVLAIIILPIGTLFLEALAWFNVQGAPRLLQLLMVVSVLGGPCVGIVILWLVDFAGLDHRSKAKVKWLSRVAVEFPVLFLLVLFLIFAKP